MSFQPPGAFITHLIKCGFKRHGPVTNIEEFETHHLDLTSLKLDVGITAPVLISKRLSNRPVVNSDELAEIVPSLDKLTLSLQKKLAVLVLGGRLMELEPQIADDLRLLGVALIDRATIEAVCSTNDWEAKAKLLSAVLVRFLGREFLSPYVSGRPAVGGRFFGRSSLLKRILPSTGNYTFVGNRRIGKTSLLKEIRELLKLQNVRTAEIYGATCTTTQDVVYKLLKSLDRFRDAEHILAEPLRAKNLASYVHRIADTEKRSVAVFIDELDRILEFDSEQNYEVLQLLRETFEGHQACRVFLAGFRKVMELKQSIAAPLFNFTTLVEMPLFNRQDAFEMIVNPLERLGIEVENTDLPAAIYRETSGHPELIQIHCSAVVRYVQFHKRVPSAMELLSEVFNTEEYKQKVLGTFLANTNPHEALLCYLLFADAEKAEHSSEYEFGPKDLNRVFKTVEINLGVPAVTTLITHLRVSGIITSVSGTSDTYRFSAPQLINYCVGLDLDFCIQESLELIKKQETLEGKRQALRAQSNLWAEPEEPEQLIYHDEVIVETSKSPVPGESSRLMKEIFILPAGGAIVSDAEGISTLTGTIDRPTIDDLNFRCLEMVDRGTDHKAFEQKLRGIGNQLSNALRVGLPELARHLKPNVDQSHLVIASDSEGLKIPFELLPFGASHLATSLAISRRITNHHLPANVQFSFQYLIESLNASTGTLRVLLVAGDSQQTAPKGEDELRVVKDHIESGCRRAGLKCEIVMISFSEATTKRVEAELLNSRPYHLFHFTGHGRHFSEDPDASGIVLREENGEPIVLSCKRLSRWLVGTNLWLAYVSSCHSSAASGSGIGLSQKYVGTMEAIVAAGVPNVVGFRWLVTDQSAFYLADEFYRQLFEVQSEKNLNLAMLEARRAVERRADYFDAWASSMLITQYS